MGSDIVSPPGQYVIKHCPQTSTYYSFNKESRAWYKNSLISGLSQVLNPIRYLQTYEVFYAIGGCTSSAPA